MLDETTICTEAFQMMRSFRPSGDVASPTTMDGVFFKIQSLIVNHAKYKPYINPDDQLLLCTVVYRIGYFRTLLYDRYQQSVSVYSYPLDWEAKFELIEELFPDSILENDTNVLSISNVVRLDELVDALIYSYYHPTKPQSMWRWFFSFAK